MKTMYIGLLAGLALAAYAGPPDNAAPPLETQSVTTAQETNTVFKATKPNEIKVGNTTYSGIAVQAVKTSQPLQLISPLAPTEYGDADLNLMRDLHGKPAGLKVFSISF